MNKPAIVCFSSKHENLTRIIFELHNYFGSEIDKTIFHDEFSLISFLKSKKNSGYENQLLVIDIDNFNIDTKEFINKIKSFSQSAIKMIIADVHDQTNLQQFVNENNSIQLIYRPWISIDFIQALNIANQSIYKHSVLKNTTKRELNFDEKVDEKVEEKINDRLHKLIDANLAKDNFLSIIAHDLKTPFFALLGISEILLNEWDSLSDETKLEFINDLHKTSDDTYKLLVTLLEWWKLQKEKLEVCVQKVSVRNLIDSTLKVTEKTASVRSINVENKITDDLQVNTDKNMIATVFRNLISNAVQYVQPGGKIEISAVADDDFYTFCIADNGAGIDQPHILELFKQGNRKRLNGNARAFKGLGLIICKDFVEKNGGQIWLETKKGLGSKFYFTIPN